MAILTFGPRSAFGFFLQPMTQELGFGRDVFSLAVAIQNLLWGAALPFAGAIADRYGTLRAARGRRRDLRGRARADGVLDDARHAVPLDRRAGRLRPCGRELHARARGVRQAAAGVDGARSRSASAPRRARSASSCSRRSRSRCSADGRLAPDAAGLRRAGAAGAAARLRGGDAARWTWARARSKRPQSFREALGEAFGHRSYVLLVLGFFTCGFHVAFITVHLPPYLVDRGLDVSWGGWVLAFIGLFNIFGAISAGLARQQVPEALSALGRSISCARSRSRRSCSRRCRRASALIFGAAMGVLWLSTVPLTSGARRADVRRRASWRRCSASCSSRTRSARSSASGSAAFSTSAPDPTMWSGGSASALGIFAALVNLPIREQPVERLAAAPA